MIKFYCDKCGEETKIMVQIKTAEVEEERHAHLGWDYVNPRRESGHACKSCLDDLLKGFIEEPQPDRVGRISELSEKSRIDGGERLSFKEQVIAESMRVPASRRWPLKDGWDLCKP